MARTHGLSLKHRREYESWRSMRQRCTNPNHKFYADYGGRGITVDPTWDSFPRFLEDMGKRPHGMTLDRIDGSLGYCVGNCRWATISAQNKNRRQRTLGHCACGYFAPHAGACNGKCPGKCPDDYVPSCEVPVEAIEF